MSTQLDKTRRKLGLLKPGAVEELIDLGWQGEIEEYVYLVNLKTSRITLHSSTSETFLYQFTRGTSNYKIFPAPKVKDIRKWLKEEYDVSFAISKRGLGLMGRFYLDWIKGIPTTYNMMSHDKENLITSVVEQVIKDLWNSHCRVKYIKTYF